VANPKLADLNVRLGIQHAFNIDKMIETVLRGDYDRATTFGSGFGEFTDMRCRSGPTTSPRRASTSPRRLQQAGTGRHPAKRQGERLTLALTYTSQEHSKRLTVLKEEAKKAGLDLELNLVEAPPASR
jgi:microcin C transport system substrate-binding protein